jgi:hypothetical protein
MPTEEPIMHPSGRPDPPDVTNPGDATAGGALRGRRVCLLGPKIEHCDGLHAMLQSQVAAVSWIPDSHSFFREQQRPERSRLQRSLDLLRGTRDPAYLEHVLSLIDATRSEIMIAYWGTLPLSDITAIKRRRPSLKVVALLLCYPLATEPLGVARQKLTLRRAASFLDGVICPTIEMASYLDGNVFGSPSPSIGVVPPCWPQSFQPTQRTLSSRGQPNLIYVGRTDLSGATVHKADDIRPLMRGILDAGIELHHASSPETTDGHPCRKPFPPLGITELIGTMAGFDASLVAYNLAACRSEDRFDLTVPDRLLSSVAAGVPIAIPRRGYAAAKTYLNDYGAVIQFDTPHELMKLLSDRAHVRDLHDIAWRARRHYSAESHSQQLIAFLTSLVDT